MNLFTPWSLRLFLDEGDGGAGGDDDEAGKSKVDDVIVDGSNDEKAAQQRRAEYEAKVRRDKRKEVEVLSEEITLQKELIAELSGKLETLAETIQKSKGGRPKAEDNQIAEMFDSVTKKIDSISVGIASRLDGLESSMEKDRVANYRRDLLASAGATKEFIQFVDQGVINISDEVLQDFDRLNGFMSKLGGLTAETKSNGKADPTQTSTTQKSVPHRDGDADTGALHTDNSSKTSVEDTLKQMNDDIDKIINRDDKENKVLSKDELTKMFDLAEKVDDTLSS